MPTIKKSIERQVGCCIYAILLLSATLSAGAPFGPGGAYTWGIGNDQLDIPVGSIIKTANLTIHKPIFRLTPIQGVVYVHLLDNPDAVITKYIDRGGDYFDGYGVFLARIHPSTLFENPSEIAIELDKLNGLSSILSQDPFTATPIAPEGPVQVTYRSAMAELLDYAGTGRSFGFGVDCDGFTFDALSLELTVGPINSPTPENRLVFTVQNPNRPPVATADLYTLTQNDPAQTLFVLANDSDPDGDPLSISAITPPSYGQAEIVENNTAVRYTPAAGYNGADSLVYTVSDGNDGTATATVDITVQATYRLFVPAVNGSVAKSPNKTSYLTGETVTLTATANDGYTFAGWSGGVSGTENPISITMDSNKFVRAIFTQISPPVPADAVYENATEMTFNGIDSYLEVANSELLELNDSMTFSAWIKLNEFNAWSKILIKPHSSFASPWEMYALDLGSNGNTPRFIVTDGIENGAAAVTSASGSIVTNQWYHIVGTYDGSSIQLYLNGQLIATQAVNFPIGTNSMPLCIGGRLGRNTIDGNLSDIRIYDRALSETECIQLYTHGRE